MVVSKLLLDTHALLWWANGDKLLSKKMRRLLEDDFTHVFVSAASAGEISTKVRLGKPVGAAHRLRLIALANVSNFYPCRLLTPNEQVYGPKDTATRSTACWPSASLASRPFGRSDQTCCLGRAALLREPPQAWVPIATFTRMIKTKRAPLPGLVVGAVVEHEIFREETAPMFAAGVSGNHYFASTVPVLESRLVIERPAGLHIAVSARGTNPPPAQEKRDGDLLITQFVAGPLDPIDKMPAGLPYDTSPWPVVGFATGKWWSTVAHAYDAMVEAKQANADVVDLSVGIKPGLTHQQQIAAVVKALHKQVRYTGLEFMVADIFRRLQCCGHGRRVQTTVAGPLPSHRRARARRTLHSTLDRAPKDRSAGASGWLPKPAPFLHAPERRLHVGTLLSGSRTGSLHMD